MLRCFLGIYIQKEILMDSNTFKNIIQKFLYGKVSKQEENVLQQFENKMIERNFSTVFSSEKHAEKIRKDIEAEVFQNVKKTFVWQPWAVAASLLIVFGSGLFFLFGDSKHSPSIKISHTITTSKDEQKEILLADGTKVTLYPESILTYPDTFSEESRNVSLSGEAFFEVAKNEQLPFVVTSGNIETQVLGTKFNVQAYEYQENVKVTLTSGKVKVASPDEQLVLAPGEQMVYDRFSEKMTSKTIDLQDFEDSKNGILRFDNASLLQVAEKMEDFYNLAVSVEVQNATNCHITGVFNREKLDVVLQQILFIHQELNVQYVSNKQIVIKGKCN